MELSLFKKAQECGRQAFLYGEHFNVKAVNKNYMKMLGIKKVLTTIDFDSFTEDDIRKILEEEFKEDAFELKAEKDAVINELVILLTRYLNYEKSLKRKIIKKDVFSKIELFGVEFETRADLIAENKGTVEVIKFSLNPSQYSAKARKEENFPSNSVELNLLYLLGKKLYLNKNIIASIYSLKSKDDKTNEYELFFEKKKGKNIVSLDGFDPNNKFLEKLIKETKIDYEDKNSSKENCNECAYNDICNYSKPAKVQNEKVANKNKSPNGSITLSYEQKYFINFKKGFLRVNAVAGAGKTTMLAFRVVNLLNKGVKPEEILLITFTDKGKEEIKEKITYWAEEEGVTADISKLNINTFNNLGYLIIKKNYKTLGFTDEPKLIDTVENYDIIKDLISNVIIPNANYNNPFLDLPYAKGVVVETANVFDNIKSFKIDNINDFIYLIGYDENTAQIYLDLYKQYDEILKKKNLIRYQDQINMLYQLITEGKIKLDFRHIIVDEFQDSDTLQIEILKELTKSPMFESLVVIGDDMQSIYSFRNVTSDNIINFHLIFPGVEDIYFTDTHRNTKEIAEVANIVIDRVNKKISKKLNANRSGKKPLLLNFEDENEEYEYISKLVEEKLQEGFKPEEISIISRQRKELLEIKKYLDSKNIPNVVVASELYLDNPIIRNLIAFSSFFYTLDSKFAVLSYLRLKEAEFDTLTFEQINDMVNKTIEEIKDKYIALNTEEEKFNFFFELINPIIEDDEIAKKFFTDTKEKYNNFNEYITYLRKFMEYKCNKSVERKAENISAVILTTAHSSKGREFDVVINTINNYKFGKNELEQEEEKRLFYVATTRAKKELYVTYNKKSTFTEFVKNIFDIIK